MCFKQRLGFSECIALCSLLSVSKNHLNMVTQLQARNLHSIFQILQVLVQNGHLGEIQQWVHPLIGPRKQQKVVFLVQNQQVISAKFGILGTISKCCSPSLPWAQNQSARKEKHPDFQ